MEHSQPTRITIAWEFQGYVKGNPSVEILGGKSHPKAQSTIKLKIDLRKNSVFRLDIK